MENNILIKRIVRADLAGYNFLASLFNQISSSDLEKEIGIDFQNCQCFEANLSAILGAILDKFAIDGYHLWLKNLNYSGVKRILSRNRFLQAFKTETSIQERENFIEYRKFDCLEADEFKEYIQQNLLNKRKFPHHTELAGKAIQVNICEIFTNATMHANCDYVYCCGEVNETTLDMTIADLGNTIPQNVNNFLKKHHKEPLNACDAIKWSIQEGNTTKSETGGLGLYILEQFITLNHGTLQIVSGEGIYEYKEGEVTTYIMSNAFPGTIVNMRFNHNDPNLYYMQNEDIDINNLL